MLALASFQMHDRPVASSSSMHAPVAVQVLNGRHFEGSIIHTAVTLGCARQLFIPFMNVCRLVSTAVIHIGGSRLAPNCSAGQAGPLGNQDAHDFQTLVMVTPS